MTELERLGLPLTIMAKKINIDKRVCSTNSYFPDDLIANCSQCKKTIYYRPYGPIDCEFICTKCLVKKEAKK